MTFPMPDYENVLDEAAQIIVNRCEKGRNATLGFYEGFPHGYSDVSFECWRRVARILGAEKTGNLDTARADAMDLLNYAAFYVMLLDRKDEKGDVPNEEDAASRTVRVVAPESLD